MSDASLVLRHMQGANFSTFLHQEVNSSCFVTCQWVPGSSLGQGIGYAK